MVAKPVSWARRRALNAVKQWAEDRGGTTEREYVTSEGETTISGGGKVYCYEAVERMEKAFDELERCHTILRALVERTAHEYHCCPGTDAGKWGSGEPAKHSLDCSLKLAEMYLEIVDKESKR
jgi:hypothetical protein